MKITDLESAVEFLKSFTSYEDIVVKKYDEKAFDLKRFRRFLKKYGVEYERLDAIHVAGSKGKGTTASLVAEYLERAGHKVGLFTSPYVIDITEGIVINGEEIAPGKFISYVKKLQKFVAAEKFVEKGEMVTYFELLTTIVFQHFLDCGVDFAVLEVGMGGRLDSTNVCKAISTVLTSVEKEHVEILGRTYKEIVREKLGVVKPDNVRRGVPLVVAPQKPSVVREIRVQLKKVPVVWAEKGGDPNYETAKAVLEDLAGRGLVKEFDLGLFVKIYHKLSVIGRFEIKKIKGRTVIFDIAHTAGSGRFLRRELEREFSGRGFVFLISMMKDKDVDGFLDELVGKDVAKGWRFVKSEVVFANSHPVRGFEASELRRKFHKKAKVVEDPVEAFEFALGLLKKGEILVVTGSHFLVGEVLRAV